MAMILWGTLDAASDQTMATVTRRSGSEFRAALTELLERVAAGIIANDPAIVEAAEQAVRDAMDTMLPQWLNDHGYVDGEGVYPDVEGDGDDVAWGFIDHSEKRMPVEFDKRGHWSQYARERMVADTKDRMADAIGISYFQGDLYGIGGEIVDNSGKILMQFDTAGKMVYPREFASDSGGGAGQAALVDMINEWWTRPSAFVDRGRLIAAGTSTAGRAILGEWRPGVPSRSVDCGPAIVDDHCAPSPVLLGDGSLMVLWQIHGEDQLIRTKLGLPDGSIDSVAAGPRNDFDIGGSSSYTQAVVVRHLSDGLRTVVRIFTRRDIYTWGYVDMTVTHATREVSFEPYVTVWSSEGNSRQTYITVAEADINGHQGFRVGAYYNPAVAVGGPIWTFEIDLETGTITAPDQVLSATLGQDVLTDAMVPSLAPLSTSLNRRLFYVGSGPAGWAVAYAEGVRAAPDAWRYKLAEWDGQTWVVSDFGVAGPRIGFIGAANYVGGMALPEPRYGRGEVVVARNSSGTGSVEVYRHDGTNWVGQTIATSKKVARPVITEYGVLFADIDHYGDTYRDYSATMRTAQEGR